MSQRCSLVVLVVAWLLGIAPVSADAAPTTATAPAARQIVRLPAGRDAVTMQLSRAGSLLVVRGTIDGEDAGWFVVDTGASAILLDGKVAAKLDLRNIAKTRAHAVGGMIEPDVAVARRFTFGPGNDNVVVAEDAMIATADIRAITSLMGVEVSGLLGGDVLAAAPFTLDLRDETLTVHAPDRFAPPPTTRPHEMRLVRQTPTVRASLEGIPGWFEIDTGSNGELHVSGAFLSYAHDLLDGRRVLSSISFGAGGRQDEFDVRFSPVTLLGRPFTDVDASYALVSEETNFREVQHAGRVGVSLLRDARLTFDYAAGRIWAEWREPEPTDAYVARLKARAARSLTRETPLMMAASAGRDGAVRALLGAGDADVNAADTGGFTALMRAAAATGSNESARLMIDAGADVNAQAAVMGLAALHYAASQGKLDTVKRLLAKRADPNVRTTLGQTPLLRAAEGRWHEVAAALLEAGADPKRARKTGETPLMLAAANGDVEMMALLLDRGRADVNQRTDDSRTALVSAASSRKPQAVRLLLERGAAVQVPYAPSTALHVAAQHGDAESVALLLAAGADANAKDREGKTPFDRAAASGRFAIMRLLLEAGAATTTSR